MNVGSAPASSVSGMMSTVCFSAPDRTDYALEGIIVSCGSPIKWLRDSLGLFGGVREAETLARSVPDSAGVALVPGFAGMGAPYWRMDAKGALTGLSFGSTKAHIVRAAFEAAAFQIADVVAAMEADGGVELADFKLDGGMTENGFVMQLIADLLGKPIADPAIAEASALGAARLAALGAGLATSLQDALPKAAVSGGAAREYSPGVGRTAALDAYGSWKKAVAKVLYEGRS
jgi:glycerol kinase